MNHPATFFQIIVPARCIFSYERRSAPAAPFSARPAAPYLHAASEKPSFCCQTSAAGCTSRRRPAVPGSPLPAPYRGGYAVTHHTAAEIVYGRADSTKPNMGLTTWKNAPKGRIRKSDVTVAKNYLNETEMRNLNEIVTMYLDYAERQARRGNVMYMADWVKRLDAFLQFNEEDILHDKGKVTAAIAKAFAEKEFEKFRILQDRTYQSDFDRLVAETSDDLTE